MESLYLRKGDNSIPIDFTIDSQGNHIIITGPNTGGKTAALKSIGLNHLISYYGLPVFGKYFKFMDFKSILADIGDNQSIIMDLSTFSSHMVNINNIVEKADNKTLVLFDELGTEEELPAITIWFAGFIDNVTVIIHIFILLILIMIILVQDIN